MSVTPNSIVTPQTPKSARVITTAANSTYTTSPTNTVLLFAGGPNGARLTRLHAIPIATQSTANQLQVFRSLDGGVTKYLSDSLSMSIYTMSQNTAAPKTDFGYSDANPMILGPNEQIYVATGQAQSVGWNVEWADY